MTIGKKIGLGFGLALATLGVIGAVSYRSTTRLIDANRAVAHSKEILAAFENLLSVVKDAEMGTRGYIITGEETYLNPYNLALRARDAESDPIKNLRRLIANNPDDQGRLNALDALLTAEFQGIKRTINTRRQLGFEAALEIVKTDRGRKIVDDIRRAVAEMRDKQDREMRRLADAAEASARDTISFIALGVPLAGPLMALPGFVVVRSIPRPVRKLLVGVEMIGRGVLDHRVNITTSDEVGELGRAFDRLAEDRQRALEAISAAVTRLASAAAE